MGTQNDIILFNKWIGTLPHKHKILIPGNHDTMVEEQPGIAKGLLSNVILLIDEGVEIEGKRFYGSPWTPEFGRWSYMLPREAMKYMWEKIPENLDVLITHGPPRYILDEVQRLDYYNHSESIEHTGCGALYSRIEIVKPKLHLFGHIHEGYGEHTENGTRFVNVSTCDKWYRPSNPPVVIDI
jgi:Icc-related predicted phosphoesterase